MFRNARLFSLLYSVLCTLMKLKLIEMCFIYFFQNVIEFLSVNRSTPATALWMEHLKGRLCLNIRHCPQQAPQRYLIQMRRQQRVHRRRPESLMPGNASLRSLQRRVSASGFLLPSLHWEVKHQSKWGREKKRSAQRRKRKRDLMKKKLGI